VDQGVGDQFFKDDARDGRLPLGVDALAALHPLQERARQRMMKARAPSHCSLRVPPKSSESR
jgi:hypothetical protein